MSIRTIRNSLNNSQILESLEDLAINLHFQNLQVLEHKQAYEKVQKISTALSKSNFRKQQKALSDITKTEILNSQILTLHFARLYLSTNVK